MLKGVCMCVCGGGGGGGGWPSQHSHVGPIWAPLGLATGPYLGCPTRAHLDLSLGSTWDPHGLAQDGPRMGPSWALTGLIAGF